MLYPLSYRRSPPDLSEDCATLADGVGGVEIGSQALVGDVDNLLWRVAKSREPEHTSAVRQTTGSIQYEEASRARRFHATSVTPVTFVGVT